MEVLSSSHGQAHFPVHRDQPRRRPDADDCPERFWASDRYVGPGGLDIGALAVFSFVWGMGGAFISLQMSRWIAKRATGAMIVDGHTGDPARIASTR